MFNLCALSRRYVNIWRVFLIVCVISICICTLITTELTVLAQSQPAPTVVLDGTKLSFDVEPFIKNGRVLVPFRKIMEKLGFQVEWNDKDQIVSAKRNNLEIAFKVGEKFATVNGKSSEMDVATEMTSGRTFLPLRFFAENSGATVEWLGDDKTVMISTFAKKLSLNQVATYKNVKFLIKTAELSSDSKYYTITGEISDKEIGAMVQVVSEYEATGVGEIKITGNSGNMFTFEVKAPVNADFGKLKKLQMKFVDDSGNISVPTEFFIEPQKNPEMAR